MRNCFLSILFLVGSFCVSPAHSQDDLAKSLVAINRIGNSGVGHEDAIAAWNTISAQGIGQVPSIMKAIHKDKPLAANWLRAAADQILEAHAKSGGDLPTANLEEIIFDVNYAPRARRMAYEWLSKVDQDAKSRIIPKMLNDSSLEMRRDAVAMTVEKAKGLEGADAVKQYQVALTAARDLDQVKSITEELEKAGEKVDLQKHFGFLNSWKLVGPFDNTDQGGFHTKYGPEADVKKTKYDGKKAAEIVWLEHKTDDEFGAVDLNETLGKNMGAIAYAVTHFESDAAKDVELRIQSKNANKIWLNGELVMENEVYHSGSKFDQYRCKARMRSGKNTLLLKICQNEQTEQWAQDWKFQLRVCDELGTAVHK